MVKSQKFWDLGEPSPPVWEKLPKNPVFFLRGSLISCIIFGKVGQKSGKDQDEVVLMFGRNAIDNSKTLPEVKRTQAVASMTQKIEQIIENKTLKILENKLKKNLRKIWENVAKKS